VVIDDGEQKALSQLALMDNTGTVHAIGLPQVVDQLCLEAPAVGGQAHILVQAMTLEQPIQAVLGGGTIGGDDAPRAGQFHQNRQTHCGHLAAQGHQRTLGLPVYHTRVTSVCSGMRLQGFQLAARLLIYRQPSKQGRAGNRASRGSGDLPGP